MCGENGQAVVEAAIILPILLVLLLCTIQIAQLQQARLMVEYAAFNAARAGVVHGGNNGKDGTSGPMHDAAALSILPSYGRTDGWSALAKTWADFQVREQALQEFRIPLVQVFVLAPSRADFQQFGQHLAGREIDFDDVRPAAADANLLSIQVRYLYELRVPFANKLLQTVWLAGRAGRAGRGVPGGLDVSSLTLAGRRGKYFVPVQAWYTMRMQSNAFVRWAAP